MNYTGQFKNINNTLYQIDIDVNNGITGTQEIVFSSDPFKVDYNGGENIYEPLKLSNATCTIITDDINTDFFSSKSQSVKVTLTNIDNGLIEWVGYATPCIYSQSWEKENELLQLELIDGVSTLENFEYKQVNVNKTTYISFKDLIIDSIKKCNCYSKIYIANNLYVSDITNMNNLIEKLFIQERNFIDTDSNNTYKDILFKLLQFLNYTLIVDGDSVYILDYNYLINNYSEYTLYSTTNNFETYSTTTQNIAHNFTVTVDSFAKNGTQINLTDTKNKASIEIENNVVTDLIPEFFDDELLENITFENGGNSSYYVKVIDDTTHIIRWVRNEKIKDFQYYYSTTSSTYQPVELEYYDSAHLKSDKYYGGTLRQIASYKTTEIPSKLSFENYVTMKRWYSSNSTNAPILEMFNYVSDTDVALLYDDYYFLIDLQINFDTIFSSYVPKEDNIAAGEGEKQALANGMFIPIKLQIGNKFWNGTAWTTTDTKFNLYFELGDSKQLYNKWYGVKNQTFYYDELDGTGQKIPILKSDYLVGNPIVRLYAPVYTTSTYSIFYGTIWMKDFEFTLTKKSNLLGVQKENTDTIYQNVIDDDFVNEFDSIKLDINTDVNKGLCYSSVLIKNDSNNFELLNEVSSLTNSTKKQEYNIIENLVELYNAPNKKLLLNLKNEFKPYSILDVNGEKYIIDSYSKDYYSNSTELTIINII